jgi:pimeloyl-ACP methyl ester carboxylesterase
MTRVRARAFPNPDNSPHVRSVVLHERSLFEESGYVALTPDWPGDPASTEEANADPEPLAGRTVGQVARHHETIIRQLDRKPALIGHSFGGALVQILAAKGLSVATVAVDPAGLRGVLPLPLSALKAAWPALRNPLNRHRAVPLSFQQFAFSFANAVDGSKARALYDQFAVPGPGMPLFPGGAREHQSVDRAPGGLARAEPRTFPDHVGRQGQHGAPKCRQRGVRPHTREPGNYGVRHGH